MKSTSWVRFAVAAACCSSTVAFATNGYFSHGHGLKSKGMAGADTAMAHDTFGGASNPAGMVWVGNRIDLGVDLFSPRRSVSRQGATAFGGIYNGSAESESNYFLIPEFGYNTLIRPDLSLGVSIYGHGGMNTDYNTALAGPPFAACGSTRANMLLGCGRLGVNLIQLLVAPTVAYKINESHSVGISPLFAYQRFKVDGLQAFAPISSAPGALTNLGSDSSTGWGVRVGWMGRVTDRVTLGAAYASKIRMGEFDKYRGLFAEQGGFDIPENYNVGLAVKASPQTTVAFDVQRINYGEIPSIANGVLNSLTAPPACQLGSACGSGFRWQNQTVYKLGIQHEYNQNWTFRGGFNYGKSPIGGGTANDISFNIIAPGVVEKHATLGLTYKTSGGGELTVSYMHAFRNTVTGPSALTALGAGNFGTESLRMYQNSLGIAYGWKM